ncbi:MAG: zinc ribbon domain-containing protein [Luteimonas sp.]|nr:zinc ribbon domain-containing protein [Luteimonas sp.]
MALIACRECGREVSDQAEACPHCGCPVNAVRQAVSGPPPAPAVAPKKKAAGCGTLIVALVTLVAVGSCWNAIRGPSGTTNTSPPAPAADPAVQARILADQVAKMDLQDSPAQTRLGWARSIISQFPTSPEAERARALIPNLEKQVAVESIGSQWRYQRNEDPMTGQVTTGATVQSTNKHNFGSPYSGPQNATLALRRHPRHGNDVMISIERGQLLCRSYGDCPVRIRFDDESPMTLTGNPPADHSSEIVFIPRYNTIVAKLAKAKRVRIEANIYQEGAPVWEFDVEGFKPEKLK